MTNFTDEILAGFETFLVMNQSIKVMKLEDALKLAYLAGHNDCSRTLMKVFDDLHKDLS